MYTQLDSLSVFFHRDRTHEEVGWHIFVYVGWYFECLSASVNFMFL